MNKNVNQPILTLVAILTMVVLTACNTHTNASIRQVKPPTQPAMTATSANENPSIIVKDQEYDGTTVIVADAFSQSPGWVAIHNQVNGSMGPSIGYAHINSGDNKNIAIKIDSTQTSSVMYAMMHIDTGEVGKYEFPGPDVPVMVNGEMLIRTFTVTVQSDTGNITPTAMVADQDISDGKVTIDSVTSKGPGWVAIHTQGADGKPGPEIGYTAVKSGTSVNVIVIIDATKATPVMFAMLHSDAGILGKYEFPGPDEPQQANGQMVSPSFKTSVSAGITPTQVANNSEPTHGNTQSAPIATPAPDMNMVVNTPAATPTPDIYMAMSTPAATPTPDMNMVLSTPAGSITPTVKVSDQPLVGSIITVDKVVSVGPGWIVIYTTNTNGQPDQPIGHTAVMDGVNTGVQVQVDPTTAQGTLYALLHVDAGVVGSFEYPGVDAPLMVGVQMIASPFKITTGVQATVGPATPVVLQPSITVSDQAVNNGTVTIAQIVSNGNWWLVIHRQNPDGSMGEYIGDTLIRNGVNQNVVVKIDLKKATPVLYAMLHEDHGIIGVLEFPGPDVPVMVKGQMITPKFNVTGLTQDVTINIQKISDTVSYLTDGMGMSLYISLQDAPGKSNCTPACLTVWQPFLVSGKIIAGIGVKLANLGIITLPDGTHQVTYLGAPLYTYTKDINPGDTNGQGVDGVWFLVTP
jgi:predicted lipoprotein with Yx(FWY)xxD motif